MEGDNTSECLIYMCDHTIFSYQKDHISQIPVTKGIIWLILTNKIPVRVISHLAPSNSGGGTWSTNHLCPCAATWRPCVADGLTTKRKKAVRCVLVLVGERSKRLFYCHWDFSMCVLLKHVYFILTNTQFRCKLSFWNALACSDGFTTQQLWALSTVFWQSLPALINSIIKTFSSMLNKTYTTSHLSFLFLIPSPQILTSKYILKSFPDYVTMCLLLSKVNIPNRWGMPIY